MQNHWEDLLTNDAVEVIDTRIIINDIEDDEEKSFNENHDVEVTVYNLSDVSDSNV